jgi:hypothetical protein
VRVWRRFNNERLVTCPETGHPAAVRIDSSHAAISALAHGRPDVRLAACSRWTDRGRCDEPCLIEAIDAQSRVACIAAQWFADKTCAYCGKALRPEHFLDHHSAVRQADGVTREWTEVPAERLQELFRTSDPVCWDCHIAETFRRTYPQLVTDRSNTSHTATR